MSEVFQWQAYVERRGSLSIGRRVEASGALTTFMVNRMAGGKVKLDDLMPHEAKLPDAVEVPEGMHPDDAIMLAQFASFGVEE